MRMILYKLFILLLIHYYKPHGYELMKKVREISRGLLKPSPGTMYPLLFLLKSQKLIREVKTSDRRKKYELTEKGLEFLRDNLPRLREMLAELISISDKVLEELGLTSSSA